MEKQERGGDGGRGGGKERERCRIIDAGLRLMIVGLSAQFEPRGVAAGQQTPDCLVAQHVFRRYNIDAQ
jgi:hypothetical protein